MVLFGNTNKSSNSWPPIASVFISQSISSISLSLWRRTTISRSPQLACFFLVFLPGNLQAFLDQLGACGLLTEDHRVGYINFMLDTIGARIVNNTDDFQELRCRIQRMSVDAQICVIEVALTEAKNVLENNRPASSHAESVTSITVPGRQTSRPSGGVVSVATLLSSPARGSLVNSQSFDEQAAS